MPSEQPGQTYSLTADDAETDCTLNERPCLVSTVRPPKDARLMSYASSASRRSRERRERLLRGMTTSVATALGVEGRAGGQYQLLATE